MSQAVVLPGNPIAGSSTNVPGLGQLSVRTDPHGVQYLRLPTGSTGNRQLLQSLCVNVCVLFVRVLSLRV